MEFIKEYTTDSDLESIRLDTLKPRKFLYQIGYNQPEMPHQHGGYSYDDPENDHLCQFSHVFCVGYGL